MAPILPTTQLSLKADTEFNSIGHDAKDIYAIATITAPDVEFKRAPIDIACVVDRSGSMGSMMGLVKETLVFVMDQLLDEDRLSLVVFDHEIQTILPLTNMNKNNKLEAKQTIESVTARGSTNLSDALYTGLKICSAREKPSDVCSVLLFTDGHANSGITVADQIVAGMDSNMTGSKPVNVFTFGFGENHDANMLRQVAEAGNGLYYYISKTEEIAQSFSDCIGGLLSVSAQNININIEPLAGTTVKCVHTKSRNPNQQGIVVGDLYAGESKDVVFELSVDKTEEDRTDQELVKLQLTYYNVVDKTTEKQEITAVIQRSKDAPMDVPNKDVDKQRVRVKQAEALQKSRLAADQGDLVGARNILQQQMQFVHTSPHQNDAFYGGMVNDMNNVMSAMTSQRSYVTSASKVMNQQWSEQANQRSNNISSGYVTKAKSAMQKKLADK